MYRRDFLKIVMVLLACLGWEHPLQAKVGREFVASDIRERCRKAISWQY